MNSYIETSASTDNLIPSFSELRTPPKTVVEGAWILLVVCVPVALWGMRELISVRIAAIKAETENRMAEDKQELAQRQALIDHLQEQNNMFLNEIMILRRTMDFSGDFTSKRSEVKNK
jgi:hypothetical protein